MLLSKASYNPAQPEGSACSCCSPAANVSFVERAPTVPAPDRRLWRKIRGGVAFAIACLTSPCCTPLLVPLVITLLAGTPVAVWLSAHIGWVYAGLTLISAAGFIVGLRWMRQKPATHVQKVQFQPVQLQLQETFNMNDTTQSTPSQPVIACDLTAIDAAERDQHTLTAQQLFASVTEVQELTDGYAFRLPTATLTLRSAADFITNERLCCPFFDFTLKVGAQSGLWLSLTGSDEVKQFVRAEFGTLVNVPLGAF